jgi:hypothetical protein
LWVVRCENLKKFTLKESLGEGGQARVFKIEKKKKDAEKHIAGGPLVTVEEVSYR